MILLRLLAVLLLSATLCAAAARIGVGDFSAGDLADWEDERFAGATEYRLVTDDGRRVLRAHSAKSASGLYRKIRVDLARTPILHWSWKVEHTLGDLDERSKAGDDYPARVYVVFSGGPFFWRTRAVNYVWSSTQPPGASWTNAYTDRARMIALRGGEAEAGRWIEERRDVRADYRQLFGAEVRYVDAVAIMTDTDDSATVATAYYGDIYFSAE